MLLVVGSLGSVTRKSFWRAADMCLVAVAAVVPFFSTNFQNVLKNRCFFRSNLFCDSKTNCVFLRLTGFSLLYANFDNLLETCRVQSRRTVDPYLDLATLVVLNFACYCSWCPFVHRDCFQPYVLPFMHSSVCC